MLLSVEPDCLMGGCFAGHQRFLGDKHCALSRFHSIHHGFENLIRIMRECIPDGVQFLIRFLLPFAVETHIYETSDLVQAKSGYHVLRVALQDCTHVYTVENGNTPFVQI